ncbi:MAG: AmmeMemoRadiSam system protein B [Halobacteriales archaeon]
MVGPSIPGSGDRRRGTDDTPLPDALDLDAGRELVSLARATVERAARADGLATSDDRGVSATAGGGFVTLERDGRLRGCCGRLEPGDPVARVVAEAAVDAAANDPRFPPVSPAELDDVTVTVTVLSPPTAVDVDASGALPDAITVGRDGLVVRMGRREGLLLPQVAVDRDLDARAFLAAGCRKAGLPGTAWRSDDVEVRRFTARSFAERAPGGEVVERRFDAASASGRSDADPGEPSTSTSTDGRPMTDGGRPANHEERQPAVAGRFYAGTADGLREQLEACFNHELGPGRPGEADDDAPRPTAVVSPHAGYPFSGPVAAHGFAALGRGAGPDTVVVLGPNHEGRGPDVAVAPHNRWRTPLGTVPVDGELAAAIVDAADAATVDAGPHAGEHSIEVQLPFLQSVLDDVAVVPVCLTRPGRDRAAALGRAIGAAVETTGRDAAVVASTDLTHYESHEDAVAADEPVVDALAALDVDAVMRTVRDGHTMCGPWATVAGLTAAERLGASEGVRLQYATSGQTAGDRSRVVGYASVAIR